jgi:RNA polymerase sigma-70 factor (ECF subfamily)
MSSRKAMIVPLRQVPPVSKGENAGRRAAQGEAESISDVALIDRALDGDRWAEGALMRRHVREVARVVARLLGTHQDVEDVVQDTFLAAFEQLDRLREPSVFRGWVLRIAVNKTRRVIRKRRFLRALGLDRSDGDAELAALADESVGPEVRAELRVLDEVIRDLPAQQRIAWMLRYVEGHTVRDVSRLCCCSMATANRRITAAQQRVRAVVDEEVLANGS